MNQVLIDKLNLMAYDNKTVYPPIELRDLDEEARSKRLDDALLRQPATGNIGDNHVLVDSIEAQDLRIFAGTQQKSTSFRGRVDFTFINKYFIFPRGQILPLYLLGG